MARAERSAAPGAADAASSPTPPYAVVIPTLGRPSLQACLEALAATTGPAPARVILVDDRPGSGHAPPLRVPAELAGRTTVLPGGARGPAAARNVGWRAAGEPWIAFLDDDTVPGCSWARDLAADLAAAGPRTAGIQGRVTVPLPEGRRPTDWERCTAGLAEAAWITADMAFRRAALADVAGFDERFRRAFREDSDLALRLLATGWGLVRGRRATAHPVRPAGPWVSVRAQRGNADDVLMARLHGRRWWRRARAPRGRLPFHLAVTAAGAAAAANGLRRRGGPAALFGGLWLAGIAEFAWARIDPGPRTAGEIRTMAVTSALIPEAASWHWLRGWWVHRATNAWSDGG